MHIVCCSFEPGNRSSLDGFGDVMAPNCARIEWESSRERCRAQDQRNIDAGEQELESNIDEVV